MCETGILHEWVVAQKWQQSCGTLLPGKVQTKGGEPTPVCENLELCNKLLKLGVFQSWNGRKIASAVYTKEYE